MELNQDKVNKLVDRLEQLSVNYQQSLEEIHKLKKEIEDLKSQTSSTEEVVPQTVSEIDVHKVTKEDKAKHIPLTTKKVSTNWERFIGENLLNKIGIIIILLGVGIGIKYAIDHNLVSPVMRIILAYSFGLLLLGTAIKLKKSYHQFSAVLLSGSMAILYITTFFMYSFYGFVPQGIAFFIMVFFTGCTVYFSLVYNLSIIAHYGLVGAYAIPFLLSDGSGNTIIFFSYISLINMGVLYLSFSKNWASLYYVTYILSWIIYGVWYSDIHIISNYLVALAFNGIFFLTFYAMFLAGKLWKRKLYSPSDLYLMVSNSFISYGFGLATLSEQPETVTWLSLFTVSFAVLHFTISGIIFSKQNHDKNVFYLIFGLGLTFLSLTIPVELEANWTTVLWSGLGLLVFSLGRIRSMFPLEKMGMVLFGVSFISLLINLTVDYPSIYIGSEQKNIFPVLNIGFLTSIWVSMSLYVSFKIQQQFILDRIESKNQWEKVIPSYLGALLVISLYGAFYAEIYYVFNSYILLDSQRLMSDWMTDGTPLYAFRSVCLNIYTLLFLSFMGIIIQLKVKNRTVLLLWIGISMYVFIISATIGLSQISDLKYWMLTQNNNIILPFILASRYVLIASILYLLHRFYVLKALEFVQIPLTKLFDLTLFFIVLILISSEWIFWMSWLESDASHKIGLSLIWGLIAVISIAFGIMKSKTYLRIISIALIAVTLIKLFFYDISHLSTVAKTVIFIGLGLLMLIASFLYNKYKAKIFPEKA